MMMMIGLWMRFGDDDEIDATDSDDESDRHNTTQSSKLEINYNVYQIFQTPDHLHSSVLVYSVDIDISLMKQKRCRSFSHSCVWYQSVSLNGVAFQKCFYN